MSVSSLENYEELEIIGKGSFGLIRKVKRKSDSSILVRKEISYKSMSLSQKKQLVNEVNLLSLSKHSNIVRYYERIVDKTNGCIYIIMEYCDGGDLGNVIRKCKKEGKVCSEEFVWVVFSQLVLALDACHSGSLLQSPSASNVCVLHRDIKPENVFLVKNTVKLGDFGLSRVLHEIKDLASTFVGTPYYMSPELVQESNYNAKSDIWSLGCLVYELCALNPPFQANNQQQLYNRIQGGKVSRIPNRYSDELDLVVKGMLQLDQEFRPSANELLQHPKVQFYLKKLDLDKREEIVSKKEEQLKELAEQLIRKEIWLVEKEKLISQREQELESKIQATKENVLVTDVNELATQDITMLKSPSLMLFSPAVKENILTESPISISKHRRNESTGFKFSPSSYFPAKRNYTSNFLD